MQQQTPEESMAVHVLFQAMGLSKQPSTASQDLFQVETSAKSHFIPSLILRGTKGMNRGCFC